MNKVSMKPSDVQTAADLTAVIQQLRTKRSYRALREWLAQIETESEYYRLIRLADSGEMYRYSNLLATAADKRFRSVRTFSWYCHSLLEQGKSLEVETRMKQRLFAEEGRPLTIKEKTAAWLLLARALCQLHRYREAEEYIHLIEEEGGVLSPDQRADFYMEANDWDRAEEEVKKGLQLTFKERGDVSWLVYAELLSRQGNHEEALRALQGGAAVFPEHPVFQLEQMRSYRLMNNFQAILDHVDHLNEEYPLHENRDYFIYLKAEALYKLEKWEELQAWMSTHQTVLQKTVFHERTIHPDGAHRQISIQPIRQKLNYCVPATLSMMLQAAQRNLSQDEIAEQVFEGTGSNLMTAIEYMSSLGFSATFFKGTIEQYKHLIDAGYPVMLDLLIEHSSHVQLVVGYDDRLGVLLVQDPNELEMLLIPYEEMAHAYRLKDRLSIAFVHEEKKEVLETLDSAAHQFFQRLFVYLEKMEQDADGTVDEFLSYLEANDDEIFSSIIGLTMIQHKKAKPFLDKWIESVNKRFGENDEDIQLLIAHSYYMHDQTDEKFQAAMGQVKQKNAYAHFLLGVVHYQNDQAEQAIFHLKRSIEKDPFQPSAYAYLARCCAELSQFQLAHQWSLVALEQEETEEFIRLTHALILLESGAVQEALAAFKKLSEEYPEDHYYVYEVGRCYMEAGNHREAIKWLKRSMEMNPAVPYPYLRIAEIRMGEEKWERAEAYLRIGAEEAVPEEETGILWLYIGHTRMGRELYSHAEEAYKQAAKLDADGEMLAAVYEAEAIIKQGDWPRAEKVIRGYAESYQKPDVYVRAGAMILAETDEDPKKDIGLELMEIGLMKGGGLEDLLSLYVECVENTPFVHRALTFLQRLRSQHPRSDVYCYESIFHEELENWSLAEKLLLKAVQLDSRHTFPHYRLGKLYRRVEEYSLAEQHLLECLTIDPDFTAASEELAELYEETEKMDEAKKYRLRVFKAIPQACDIRELAEMMSSPAEQQKLTEHLVDLKGRIDEDWRLEALSEVLSAEKAISLLEKEESIHLKARLAELYIDNGQTKKALELLTALISEDPSNDRLYEPWMKALHSTKKLLKIDKFIKGMALSRQEEALVYGKSGAALAPYVEELPEEEPGVWKKLTGGLKSIGLISAVIALYEKAIKLNPDHAESYNQLAAFYIEREVLDEAIKVLKLYLKRRDDDDFRLKAAAAALSYGIENGKEKYLKEANEQLLLLKKRHPSDGDVRDMLADSFLFLGELEQALHEYEELIKTAPYKAEGYAGRVLAYLELEEKEKARSALGEIPEEMYERAVGQLQETMADEAVLEELLHELETC
ncbi:tetratricopeptide repeat protein [Pseudobacillus badius]|uniref:tetratricopeptide repeat protein n=1 Tax=Bacillus badius TaxID=1455 RepID=UPI0024A321AD|nr:tetratricopeptide repeat protein [Bacillus badius]GLY10327.1 hypothetical protein Bbad01_15430 [Bacillus badius]